MRRITRGLVWVAAGAGIWLVLAVVAQVVRLAPGWPLWAVAGGVTFVGWVVRRLYGYETLVAGPLRARRLILLRLAALGLLAWLLLEPTWVRVVARRVEREVVLLFDQSASMRLVDDGTGAARIELARAALGAAGLERELSRHLRVRTLGFARSPDAGGAAGADGWGEATDIAAALATVLDQTPPEQLAGAVLVSDGRHNRPSRVEEPARRFGMLDAPVGVVAVGSPDPPRDAAIVAVRAPEAVHHGDRMRVDVELRFDRCKGERAVVRLVRGSETLEHRVVPVPQDAHREEIRFIHQPDAEATGGYAVEIDRLAGERFDANNRWAFETSITTARTRVLLVDSYPRWEFRYLRNLLHGRDKSVHLQWVLTTPEHVAGLEAWVVHCPMAFDGEGADWLSATPEVLNPYFGAQMLRCGTVRRALHPEGEAHDH